MREAGRESRSQGKNLKVDNAGEKDICQRKADDWSTCRRKILPLQYEGRDGEKNEMERRKGRIKGRRETTRRGWED